MARRSQLFGVSGLIFAGILVSSQLASAQIIPPHRNFPWNPGMMSKGGVPNRATQCGATLLPSGGDDTTAIQNASNACPAGQAWWESASFHRIEMAASIALIE
jgi:hypothetical protein